MSQLLQQVEQSIGARRLLRPGQSILVAVSGGLDSMVLLDLLNQLSKKRGWRLTVAHLNHCLRGRSSNADERLVRATATRLGLPVIVERANVRQFARRGKLSLEMAARRLRHDFLARAAARRRGAIVALAHHADDQLELFFLRLLRGSGGEGLAGMKWSNASPSNPRIKLARPLLDCAKSELREYAAEKRIQFREDATNAWLDIRRNRVRHELLPLLRDKYQPAIRKTVLRTMDIVGAEAEVVTSAAREWLAQVRKARPGARHNGVWRSRRTTPAQFEKLAIAVQRRVIQLELIDHDIAPDYEMVEQLRAVPDRPIAVRQAKPEAPKSVSVARDLTGILRIRDIKCVDFDTSAVEVNLTGRAGEVVFGGAKIGWRFEPKKNTSKRKPVAGHEEFDADRIGGQVVLRHWRRGDRFQPIGMTSPVKLQDFFTNEKVPRSCRHQLIIGVAASGEVFWVEGLRISERFKLTKETNRRLQWRWRRRYLARLRL